MAMDALKEAIKRKRMNLSDNPEDILGDYEENYVEGLSDEEQAELEQYLSDKEIDMDMEPEDETSDEMDLEETKEQEEKNSYGMSPSVDDKEDDAEMEVEAVSMKGEIEPDMEQEIMSKLYDKDAMGKPGLRGKVAKLIEAIKAQKSEM